MSSPSDDDPGWGSLGAILGGAVSPGRTIRRAAGAPNVLVVLRQVFLGFSIALVLFGIVLVLIRADVEDPPISSTAATVGVFAVGWALQGLSYVLERDLSCDETRMLGEYRTRFFLRTASSEAAALLGFVSVFLTGSLLPYLAGLVPAAFGFARNAPTRRNFLREDELLAGRGCPHSLYRLLRVAEPGKR